VIHSQQKLAEVSSGVVDGGIYVAEEEDSADLLASLIANESIVV